MSLPSIIDACRLDIFTHDSELDEKYPPAMAERIKRIREMYNYWLANPTVKDRHICLQIMSRFGVSQSRAYSDLAVIHTLVPLLSPKSRDYHRTVYNEMIMETYNEAKARGDTRSMVAAATSYAKANRVDLEDEMSMPYDDIVPQPYCPTLDVSVLGIKPMKDAFKRIEALQKELARDLGDVEDVEYEDADLELDNLFSPLDDGSDRQA